MDNSIMPAAPIFNSEGFISNIESADPDAAYSGERCHGLTKREYFAGMAMQGVLADSYMMDLIRCDDDKDTDAFVAGLSVEYADALLEELEK